MRLSPGMVLTALLATLGAACSGGGSKAAPSGGGSSVVIPNAPAGDAQARGVSDPSKTAAAPQLTPEQARTLASCRRQQAEAIWNRAVSLESKDPGEAADLFEDITDDYPEYERAAEARFREGRARYRARDYDDATDAFVEYMKLAPVNPHLAEVEQMLYQCGVCYLASNRGPLNIFGSDSAGLSALKFLAQTFPTGEYADDALLQLGDYYRRDEDFAAAALHYKELLLRYPDSEWSFKARLRLADTYLARDQGDPYNAGFVVLDPREPVPEAALIMGGPVESAIELALEQYEGYLERMEADPGRLTEYAKEVAYARKMQQCCRERLASKELARGDWYAGRGDPCAAISYWQAAARWGGTRAGTAACSRLATQKGRTDR